MKTYEFNVVLKDTTEVTDDQARSGLTRQRRPLDSNKPLEGAWEGTWPVGPPFGLGGGRARAMLLGNKSLPPECECRVGPDDYFVQMESANSGFPFLPGGMKWQNFVLRKMPARDGTAMLHGQTVGPGGDDGIYYIEVCLDERGFTLIFNTPRLACTPIYKIRFTRFISQSR